MDPRQKFEVEPIGVVRSRLVNRADAPRQGDEGAPIAEVHLDEQLALALDGIAVGDRLTVVTWLHEADRATVTVHPRGDRDRPRVGVFATRSPDRPNPIGIHHVEVVARTGMRLRIAGLEAIDGTPVLDVKVRRGPVSERRRHPVGLARALDQMIDAAAVDGFHGVVAVDAGGGPVLRRAVGLADRTAGIPHEVTTRMRVASVSKLLTSLAVLRLAERGELRLDQPIAELVAAATDFDTGITVDHLLMMTAGITDWFDEGADDVEAAWDDLRATRPLSLLRQGRDYLPLFIDAPPIAPPGTGFRYSNASYVLLGLALEAVTGRPYGDVIATEVTRPAGMGATGMDAIDDRAPGVAEGYLSDGRRNVLHVTPVGAGDGGAVSSAHDLLALARAVRDPAVSRSTWVVAAMTTSQVRMDDTLVRGYEWWFGRGLQFVRDPDTGEVVRWGVTGEEDGVSARLYHYPVGDVDVAILSNVSGGASAVAWDLHDGVLAADVG